MSFTIGTPADSPTPPPRPAPTRTSSLLGIASYENLIALANARDRILSDGPQRVRKIVWRDKGQPVVLVRDLRSCLEYAAKGGLHAAGLAYAFRSALNLVLVLVRIRRVSRDKYVALLRHALFGEEPLRFAAMLGTFASLYKLILNALPLLIPTPSPSPTPLLPTTTSTLSSTPEEKQSIQLSLTASAQQILIRKKSLPWHAPFAGFLAGGAAVLWEEKRRRGAVGSQMFVRGLQGSYNAFTSKRGIVIPHGEILVFALACGQIMYAFVLRKDTIPRAYDSWIRKMSRVPAESLRINQDLIRGRGFQMADMDILLKRHDVHPKNNAFLQTMRTTAVPFLFPTALPVTSPSSTSTPLTPPHWPHPFAPCSAIHPPIDSCTAIPLDRFLGGFRMMLPGYGALHFVPALVFKRQAFARLFRSLLNGTGGDLRKNANEVGRLLGRAGWGTARSSAFLGMFIVIYQSTFCYKHYLYRTLTTSPSFASRSKYTKFLISLLASRLSFWIPGFLTGLSLFVEAQRRRGELAMYVLPKALESVWVMARGKGLVRDVGRWGDVVLTAVGMSMVMGTYQNDPQHLSGLVRRIMYQFIGPN